METEELFNTLNELLAADDFTGAKQFIRKVFNSLDEDTKAKVLLTIYASALEEINMKKQMHELRKDGLAALEKLDAMPDDTILEIPEQHPTTVQK